MGKSRRSGATKMQVDGVAEPYKRKKARPGSLGSVMDVETNARDFDADKMDTSAPKFSFAVATEQKEEATRGAILQRHKLEYKKVRDEIAKMKENKRKLNRHDAGQKREKKDMGKQMKTMLAELQAKHVEELRQFDEKTMKRKPTENYRLDMQSINLAFSSFDM